MLCTTPQRGHHLCEHLKNVKTEQKDTNEKLKSLSRACTLPQSQLPILLTTFLLLYCFQAALALGLSTTARAFAQSTRQTGQLDLLHVLYRFILGILQQVSLSLQTGRKSKEGGYGPGPGATLLCFLWDADKGWTRPRPMCSFSLGHTQSSFQAWLEDLLFSSRTSNLASPAHCMLVCSCSLWFLSGDLMWSHWGHLNLPYHGLRLCSLLQFLLSQTKISRFWRRWEKVFVHKTEN